MSYLRGLLTRVRSHLQAIVKDPPCAIRTGHRPGIALVAPIEPNFSAASRAGPSTICSGRFHLIYTYRRPLQVIDSFSSGFRQIFLRFSLEKPPLEAGIIRRFSQSVNLRLPLNLSHSRLSQAPVRVVLDKPGRAAPSRTHGTIQIRPHRLGRRTNLKRAFSLACLFPPDTASGYKTGGREG